MGMGAIVSAMGAREAADYVLKRTRKYLADKKAREEKARKERAEKAADTYQPGVETKPLPTKKKKKPATYKEAGKEVLTTIEKRKRMLREASK